MKKFSSNIYQIGINWAVDVPDQIARDLTKDKGYIRIKGRINGFDFIQTLVPVKNAPYRLFVNLMMMKGGKTAVGEIANFEIEQNETPVDQIYQMPQLLEDALTKNHLMERFNSLTASRRKDILKYLHYIKTAETMQKNIDKVVSQLERQLKDVRIP